MRENGAEVAMGAIVLAIAVGFFFYVMQSGNIFSLLNVSVVFRDLHVITKE